MKFKNGDKVRFLNDIGGGVINRIDDKGNIFVQTEDGFEIPVREKELVLSGNFNFSDNERKSEIKYESNEVTVKKQEKIKIEKQHHIPENINDDSIGNITLGFFPESSGPVFASKIACYLVNDSPYFIYYLAGKKEGGKFYYISSGYVEANTKTFIDSFDQTSLSKISDIHLQLMFLSRGRYSKKEPIDALLNLNLVNFSKESYYQENEYFDEKAVIFNILGKDNLNSSDIFEIPESIKKSKEAEDIKIKPKKREPENDTLQVDLHYEEAQSNGSLSSVSILALQMKQFHTAIEEAISRRMRRLIIIHGIGNGILKTEIRKELQEKYPQFLYQDASFKEYGFGATMVHLVFENKQ